MWEYQEYEGYVVKDMTTLMHMVSNPKEKSGVLRSFKISDMFEELTKVVCMVTVSGIPYLLMENENHEYAQIDLLMGNIKEWETFKHRKERIRDVTYLKDNLVVISVVFRVKSLGLFIYDWDS